MSLAMVSRRVGHEAIELIHYCGPISLETQNIGSDELVYLVKLKIDDMDVAFMLDRNFPFSPPRRILVNNKDYIRVLGQSITRFSQLGIELGFPRCFCCESLTCSDRWNASVGLVKLYNEIKDVISKKQLIMQIWFCRQIASDKLTYDVPLENYL
ncbi:MAG: hypothetical protein ACXABD_00085 [Candidatus Thorarchaeota archaeon]|jgi:hypothetical protein